MRYTEQNFEKEGALQDMIQKAKKEGNTDSVEALEKQLVKVTLKGSKMKTYE